LIILDWGQSPKWIPILTTGFKQHFLYSLYIWWPSEWYSINITRLPMNSLFTSFFINRSNQKRQDFKDKKWFYSNI
jgi:hypothetical protein